MKDYKDANWVGFLAVKKEHEKTLALLMKSQEEEPSDIVSWRCFRTPSYSWQEQESFNIHEQLKILKKSRGKMRDAVY